MPKLMTPDGGEMDEAAVNRAFAESMAAPEPDEETAPAPKRKDPDNKPEEPAEPQEKPADTKPRTRASSGSSGRQRSSRGRGKAKTETPTAPAEGAFVQPVAEFLQAVTFVGALAPIPPGPLKTRVRLQAQLVNEHAGGLAGAIDAAASHNEVIRKGVEALTMGSAGWVLPAVLAVAPFAAQSLGLWKAPVSEEMAQAAEVFEINVRTYIQDSTGQAEAA